MTVSLTLIVGFADKLLDNGQKLRINIEEVDTEKKSEKNDEGSNNGKDDASPYR